MATANERQMYAVRRRCGMLFQDGALFDSLSVGENVSFPLVHHATEMGDAQRREQAESLLERVGLPGTYDRAVASLSGGQRKRVGLARAMVLEPEILLCDEPFSGLDPPNVERIEALFSELCRSRGLTLIVTSHHMASSLRMSDQIVLLRDGRAVPGTPGSLATSGDPEITNFLGTDGAVLARQVSAETAT